MTCESNVVARCLASISLSALITRSPSVSKHPSVCLALPLVTLTPRVFVSSNIRYTEACNHCMRERDACMCTCRPAHRVDGLHGIPTPLVLCRGGTHLAGPSPPAHVVCLDTATHGMNTPSDHDLFERSPIQVCHAGSDAAWNLPIHMRSLNGMKCFWSCCV